MILKDVMEEIANKLQLFAGISSFAYPADSIKGPAAVLGFPERIEYDVTYNTGECSFWNLPVYMLTDRTDPKSARDSLSAWCGSKGSQSVAQFLSNERYTTCDQVQVVNAALDVVSIAGIEYFAAIFECNVTGEGM